MIQSDFESPAEVFLSRYSGNDPSNLYVAFAEFLLENNACASLPIPIDIVRSSAGFDLLSAALINRGMVVEAMSTIVVNEADLATTQRFTQAHEIMESLSIAVLSEGHWRFPNVDRRKFQKEKESLCDAGAAALLMPASLFFPQVRLRGVSLANASELSRLCGTSLTATVRRMLDADFSPTIFVKWSEGHKKNEQVPSRTGQTVLWGAPHDWDPPAELRVARSWKSPSAKVYLCSNESVSRDTVVYSTLSAKPGQIQLGYDDLDLTHLKGLVRTESVHVKMNGSPVVLSLIHLT